MVPGHVGVQREGGGHLRRRRAGVRPHVEIDLAPGRVAEGRGDGGHRGREPRGRRDRSAPGSGADCTPLVYRLGAAKSLVAPRTLSERGAVAPTEAECARRRCGRRGPHAAAGLGELGMVRSVRAGAARRRWSWPVPVDAVARRRRARGPGGPGAGSGPRGAARSMVEVATMTDDERAELHRRLAARRRGRARGADVDRRRRPRARARHREARRRRSATRRAGPTASWLRDRAPG